MPYAEHHAELTTGHDQAYALLADVTRWPLFFTPCVHTEVLDRGPGRDRFRIWAIAGDSVRSWTSGRTLDPVARRIRFAQENSKPPFTSMGGHWQVEPTRLVLGHHWELSEPTPANEQWVKQALDRNSNSETAAVTRWATHPIGLDELSVSFTEEVAINAPGQVVYDFLYRADLWPERLPHVASLDLATTPVSDMTGGAEVQTMTMETKAPDGSLHTTRSIRLCFGPDRIVYKQTTVPRVLSAHSGEWKLVPSGDGVVVHATHHFVLDPDAIEDVLGAGTSIAEARAKVQEVLARNSLLTLEQARAAAVPS